MKPRVTDLIAQLDKPALLAWANRQGLAGIDIAQDRKRAKKAGTSLHEQIQARQFIDPLHAGNFARFIADKEIIAQEVRIETEWFVGRYDCKLKWKGLTYLVDWKSGNGLYFENKLQLAAYGMAEKMDRAAVVNIPDFIIREANIERDRAKYEQIIIALSKIYQLRQELGA